MRVQNHVDGVLSGLISLAESLHQE